ncbi:MULTISPECIES: hypothetical protein [unclassified Mesorhizobium]|uniref:hypothetical protein n=1 Tax=unclassified Mesorhizobium TaxID=325217 RepID=UPI000BAF6E7F|nr:MULTISPECIES: hypothetical protein [unclassified Mesorhizobium]TGT56634.1 hypothetical protein EN813_042545 [Mesorhizobium sp. M00.F.Ca.ET.170.01.1.1]AZO11684.1 hypothetical protein EJ074_23220 [Mesorhizobium sp. M3A.F.Ca.ET.080.04.2.1]PBB86701.1 hypothetical protein CK216_10500 [Mesorhizobium sp. WSM3876]RWB72681.1 MAG: hypothetical protein EOQ49_11970 [Mesorhizobium sp.]RWB87048.1 MAG: hypothetical protein EOQ52_17425 [Mesorhizobium sp.]
MTTRKDRLKKLVLVQEQLKALHETRHAGFLAAAAAAEAEARQLTERFDADGSLAGLFPELYHRRIANALEQQEANLESARQEAALIATATARTNMVERAYKDVRRRDERERTDRERLDLISQKRGHE